ncbi:MAG: phage capsid protein [Akkermansia sp.]
MDLTQPITAMFRTKRETKWNTQIQQDTEIVKPFVTIHTNCIGKAVEMPAYGRLTMREYAGQYQKVEWTEPKFGKRTMRPRKFYNAVPLEEDDKMDMETLDFTASNVMSEQRKALARMNDEVILGVVKDTGTGLYRTRKQTDGICGGILAPNYTGDDGATIEELDTAPTSFNVIPVDYKASGTKTASGMLLDKIALLRARYQMLDMFKAGRGEEIVIAITPAQHMDLLLMEQTQNRNYGFSSLTNGEVNSFLGVKFLVTNMLPLDASGNRLCVAWLKSRIEFGVWKDAQFRIDPRNEYVGVREQILVKAASGATRKDKDMVFLMPCKEA